MGPQRDTMEPMIERRREADLERVPELELALVEPAMCVRRGAPRDVWIFRIAMDLAVADGPLAAPVGGALAREIFWRVAGRVTVGTPSDFKGAVSCKTQIAVEPGAVMNGRALAQVAITLDASVATRPS